MLITNAKFYANLKTNYGNELKIITNGSALTVEQWFKTVSPFEPMMGNLTIERRDA